MYFSRSDSHFCCSSARLFLLKVQNVELDVITASVSSLENAGAEQVGAAWRVISVFLHLTVFTERVKIRGSVSVSADGQERAVIERFTGVHQSPARETLPVWRPEEEHTSASVLLDTRGTTAS